MTHLLTGCQPIGGWLSWISASRAIDVSGLSLTKRKIVALAAELKARGIRILVPLRGTPKMMKSSSRAIPKRCGRNDASGLVIGGFALGGNP
jgi:hypothetical protein